jgi:tRNA(Ser,Leu) C12 N-acetylase TAN1
MLKKNMNGLNMKSLEDLKKAAINSAELTKYVRVLVRELEDKILAGLKQHMKFVSVDMYFYTYSTIAADTEECAKIILYNILEIMKTKKYKVKVIPTKGGYKIVVDISENSNLIESLDKYLAPYMMN